MSVLNLSSKTQYNILSKASLMASAMGTRTLLTKGWKMLTDKEPPKNPASPSVMWRDALLWGAASGLLVGVAKITMRRLTTKAWHSQKGAKPKGTLNE